jgi:hypothetical protein
MHHFGLFKTTVIQDKKKSNKCSIFPCEYIYRVAKNARKPEFLRGDFSGFLIHIQRIIDLE